jgi:uncharacterized protein
LTWTLAKAVIDAAFDNAAETNQPPSMTFHGGGEPTLHWSLLIRAVQYARGKAPDCHLSMASNGIWSVDQRAFICEHFSDVSLSLDGVAEVQNAQRPFADGSPSFEHVMRSIDALELAGVDYGIRMTVLPESVSRLVESVRFICSQTDARAIQVEPTFTSDRGQYAEPDIAFADAFAAEFLRAVDWASQTGRQVYYSGARPWVLARAFCLAPVRALCVTPDGLLVSCFEIHNGSLQGARPFVLGRVDRQGPVYDRDALDTYLTDIDERRKACRECFCYWHCCGDCATRRQGRPAIDMGRCRITRSVTRELIARQVAENNGLWTGQSVQEACDGC